PGQRCGARTRRGTECLKPALKDQNRCQLHGGRSCGATTLAGREKLAASKTKHGRFTKQKRAEAKRRAETGRRILAKLKQIERQIIDADLMPHD
ncbi:MAG: HGGxSTG domain-containing protein, partial [Paracoccaceae bacterium]|nr:HGGxSTG domain-containing protein [Paracoccaceae bacterium]